MTSNDLGVLHNVLGVLRNVLDVLRNALGVLRNEWSRESMGCIGMSDRTFACKSQECLWQDWYTCIYS